MNKFKTLYNSIVEELRPTRNVTFEDSHFEGVLIDPDRQTVEPFSYTGEEIKEIRKSMIEPQEDEITTIPGAVLLSDAGIDLNSTDFLCSVSGDVRGGVCYVIPSTDSTEIITVDVVEPEVQFGSLEDLQ